MTSDPSIASSAPGRDPAPPTLILAGVLTVIEGLGILVATGWLFIGILRDRPAEAITAWGAAGLLGLFGAGVVFAARGVLRAARWSRAPTTLTQLLLIAISAQLPWAGVVAVIVALAVVTGVLLFLRPSTAAFVGPQDRHLRADEKADGNAPVEAIVDPDPTAPRRKPGGATRRKR